MEPRANRTWTRSALLAGMAALLVGGSASAQNPETTPRDRASADAPVEIGMSPKSSFGETLSDADAVTLLREMRQLAEQALAASRGAEQGESVPAVKAAADQVFQLVWGHPSGVSPADGSGAVASLGWKEHWQVNGSEFHANFVRRYGAEPPRITDPRALGIMGRGRAVRGRLEEITRGSSKALHTQETAAEGALTSLNNVIGWTYVTAGLKGREDQPRISLTHVWDAPVAFWNSTADTGWMGEVHAQATNILKTDYAGDLAEARTHAAGLTTLLTRVLNGVDADRNGVVEAKPMEGGLAAALETATRTSLQAK